MQDRRSALNSVRRHARSTSRAVVLTAIAEEHKAVTEHLSDVSEEEQARFEFRGLSPRAVDEHLWSGIQEHEYVTLTKWAGRKTRRSRAKNVTGMT